MKHLTVVTDASFREELQMAGIAVWSTNTRELVAAEVLPAQSSFEGEALAVIRACTHLATWEAPAQTRIWTDCLPLVDGVAAAPSKERGNPVSELAVMLERHWWVLEHRPRAYVRAAHIAAGAALNAWKAGTERRPTWNRTPYLPTAEAEAVTP